MTDKTSQIFMSDCSLLYPQQLPVATCQLAGNWEGGSHGRDSSHIRQDNLTSLYPILSRIPDTARRISGPTCRVFYNIGKKRSPTVLDSTNVQLFVVVYCKK